MSFSVQEVIQWIQGRLANGEELGSTLDQIRVERPSSLSTSQPHDLSFFFNRAFEHELPSARPGILITGEPFVAPLKAARLPFWKTTAVVACADPYLAMALLSGKFAEKMSSVAHLPSEKTPIKSKIHPSAVVSPTAVLGEGVLVGANCVIEDRVRIGSNTVLYPGCFIGPGSQIGQDSVLFPHVTVYEWSEIGNRVRIHSGSVIGADGFGYAPVRSSINGGKLVEDHQKIYHLGRVVIEDDVEMGANSCIDRGTLGDTRIGKKSKLDNLVHVGHNSFLDEGVIICGGTCLAGNSKIGKFVYIGGLTGVTNHVHVKDRASVGALSLVTKDVEEGCTAVGNPQRDYQHHFKAHAKLNRLLAERKSK